MPDDPTLTAEEIAALRRLQNGPMRRDRWANHLSSPEQLQALGLVMVERSEGCAALMDVITITDAGRLILAAAERAERLSKALEIKHRAQERAEAEVAALKHDIERHIALASEEAEARCDAEAEAARLREALAEAIAGWEEGSQYKGDYLRRKHHDEKDIARVRDVLDAPRPKEQNQPRARLRAFDRIPAERKAQLRAIGDLDTALGNAFETAPAAARRMIERHLERAAARSEEPDHG